MSFDNSLLCRITSSGNSSAPVWWSYGKYIGGVDTLATIIASGYFNDAQVGLVTGEGKFKVSDVLHVQGSDDNTLVVITSVTTNVTVQYYEHHDFEDGKIVNAHIADNTIVAADKLTLTGDGAIALGDAVDITPTRTSTDYAYHVKVEGAGSGQMTGGAAQKTYMLGLLAERPSGSNATGDSNDALIKGSYNNRATNDSNFIFRGINMTTRTRSGGAGGRMDGAMIGSKCDSGGTMPIVLGAQIIPENYGTVATEFGGVEVLLKNESNSATTTYGVKVRNADLSSQAAIQAAYWITDDSTNGFGYGLDMNGITIGTADIRLSSGDAIINAASGTIGFGASNLTTTGLTTTGTLASGNQTVTGVVGITADARPSSDYAYFLNVDADEYMTGGVAQKTYMLGISGERPLGSNATGDSNDAIIKAAYSNYAVNDANFILRGINMTVTTRSGGAGGRMDGAMIGSKCDSGGTMPTVLGAQIISENYGTVATEFGGAEILLKNESNSATTTYGIKVRNAELSSQAAIQAAYLITDDSTNGFGYGLDMNGITIGTADIRLNNGETISNATDGIVGIGGALAVVPNSRPASDYAYFLELDCDEYITGGVAQKTYMLGISGERPSGSAATGDSNDAVIKGSYSNYAANDANFIIRGMNTNVTNRSGGTLGIVEGCAFGAANKSGGTCPTLRGMTIRGENYGTNATEFGVLDVNCSDEVGAATLRYGARIRNTDGSAVAAMGHALLINSTATNGFDNAITVQNACDTFVDFDDATGLVAVESGSAASTFKFRVKVVSPDGTDCWINAYSTSNA